MDPAAFLTELKRRKVYRVAVAYAIVAWLLIQAASILFPTFEAPSWVMKVFVTAVILGFPVALILGMGLGPDATRNQARGRSCAEGIEDTQGWQQMDGDHCRRRYDGRWVTCFPICANANIGDCRIAKTKCANCGDARQVSCRVAVRESQLGQGERIFRAGYSGRNHHHAFEN